MTTCHQKDSRLSTTGGSSALTLTSFAVVFPKTSLGSDDSCRRAIRRPTIKRSSTSYHLRESSHYCTGRLELSSYQRASFFC